MMANITRYISCFDKRTEKLVKEIPLPAISLDVLHELFRDSIDGDSDPMMDMFRIGRRQAAALTSYAEGEIDVEQYDCFLECHAATEPG